jgi:uncharacterized protein (TIGR03437 family)
MGGQGPHILRTVNNGSVWDDITGNLADTAVHAAAADRATGIAWVATDRGVFTARVDLNDFSPASSWSDFNSSLPSARAMDVAIDGSTGQLFAAVEGYGLFTTPLSNRDTVIRILNAADLSTRPAAPGSLISVSGAKVTAARSSDLEFPVLASGETASQLQVPFETRADSLNLEIEAEKGRLILPLQVRTVSPAIFTDHDGAAFMVDADSGLSLDLARAARPAQRLQLMATGLGRVRPDWPTGKPAPAQNAPAVVAPVQVVLDGVPLSVSQATLAPGYVGYYLIEFQLPAVLNAGLAGLYLTVDGQESNRVLVMLSAD